MMLISVRGIPDTGVGYLNAATGASDTTVSVPVGSQLVHLKSKSYQPIWVSFTGALNQWEKVVPYLDGIEMRLPAGTVTVYMRKPIEKRSGYSPSPYDTGDDAHVPLQVTFK